MSIVTLQIGQCGNQIGGELFSTILEDAFGKASTVSKADNEAYIDEVLERFFHRPDSGKRNEVIPRARAVMVDMEPKAIAQSMLDAKKSGRWVYPKGQQFCQKRGSGNNWAHGYCKHGPQAQEAVMDMVQREAEKCDRMSGFLVFMSLAGGTGSGVGAYITECLRDHFPHSFITNQVVAPYNTGEVIVQNYNALLTLSHLYQSSDALLILENDQVHKICMQLLGIKNISFRDINKVIAHKLASVLQPVKPIGSNFPSYMHSNHISDMLTSIVPHPEYKLLTMKNIPQMSERSIAYSTFTWSGLLKHLRQMLIANAAMEEGIDWQVKVKSSTSHSSAIQHNKSIANLLLLRGKDVNTANVDGFQESCLYAPWVPSDAVCSVWATPRPFNLYEKSATLLSNSQSPIAALNTVVGKAWNMFASRAYVHQYIRYGLAEEDFVDSFAGLEQVIKSYSEL
ncbi:tubulin delta chain-like [Saccoglossus kowalevskii]|uniref:Tubulin delta chain n=1 Tax=Saccoglossus kowalevskii TaxID=10224 RepID=A0ABM0GRD7_SACKO|nr:PREDICTED: tubulin delta chain-like [Saccoglossus kowalevskii]